MFDKSKNKCYNIVYYICYLSGKGEKNTMKKFGLSIVLVLMLAASAFMMTGCGFGGGDVEEASQLHGRWNLRSNSYTAGIGRSTTSVRGTTHFIQFNEDGTFSLSDYWWGTASGTWTFNANNSSVSLTVSGFSTFSSHTRIVQISEDGNNLQMEFDHSSWSYRNRYERA